MNIKMKNKYKGGILLTTLLLVFLFSFIFMLVLEDFWLTQRFTQKTKEYYIAQTMVSMFLSDVKQGRESLGKKGEQKFSAGTIQYEYEQMKLNVIVHVNNKTFRFQEEYQEIKTLHMQKKARESG